MCDVSGPYEVSRFKGAKKLRNQSATTKCWAFHMICMVSGFCSIGVLEGYDTVSFIKTFYNLACRYGYPSKVLVDNSSTILKGLGQTEFIWKDFTGSIKYQYGIDVQTCATGPSSHAKHGKVERNVGLVKQYLNSKKIQITELSPIEFQTVLDAAAAQLNSMPLCYKKKELKSESSKLVTPYTFLIGRGGPERTPVLFPYSTSDKNIILKSVEKVIDGLRGYFMQNLPDLILKPQWIEDDKEDQKLEIDDVVLFTYKESPLKNIWKIGIVQNLEASVDGTARIVEIKYCNSDELILPTEKNSTEKISIKHRLTRKSIRTIVKLYSIDDPNINKDLEYLEEITKEIQEAQEKLFSPSNELNEKEESVLFDNSDLKLK